MRNVSHDSLLQRQVYVQNRSQGNLRVNEAYLQNGSQGNLFNVRQTCGIRHRAIGLRAVISFVFMPPDIAVYTLISGIAEGHP